jgi:hypothetical protein
MFFKYSNKSSKIHRYSLIIYLNNVNKFKKNIYSISELII